MGRVNSNVERVFKGFFCARTAPRSHLAIDAWRRLQADYDRRVELRKAHVRPATGNESNCGESAQRRGPARSTTADVARRWPSFFDVDNELWGGRNACSQRDRS